MSLLCDRKQRKCVFHWQRAQFPKNLFCISLFLQPCAWPYCNSSSAHLKIPSPSSFFPLWPEFLPYSEIFFPRYLHALWCNSMWPLQFSLHFSAISTTKDKLLPKQSEQTHCPPKMLNMYNLWMKLLLFCTQVVTIYTSQSCLWEMNKVA